MKVKISHIEPEARFFYATLLIEYDCECGTTMHLYTTIKPKKLVKCFQCNIPISDYKKEPKKSSSKKGMFEGF